MDAENPVQTGFFLTNESDGQQFTLFNGAVIGRSQGDLSLQADPRMSSKHARFTVDEADVFVEDLGSRNGVFVNGTRLESGKPFRVFPGDMIAMGNSTFCLGRLSGTPVNPIVAPAPKEDTHTAVVGKHKPKAPPPPLAPTPLAPAPAPIPQAIKPEKNFAAFVPEPPTESPQSSGKKTINIRLPKYIEDLMFPMSEDVAEGMGNLAIFGILLGMLLVYLSLVIKGMSVVLISQEDLLSFGANYAPLTTNHQWWRLITSAFVHSSLLHLFINQLLIWKAGTIINRSAGALGFVCVFFISHVCGALFAIWTQQDVVFVGATAGTLGCIGAALGCFAVDLKIREEFSAGQLIMAALVLFAANLKTGLQIPMDYGYFALAFVIGCGLRFAVAPAVDFDNDALWKQILRPLGTFVVCATLLHFTIKQVPALSDPSDQLAAALENAIPIAQSYDEIRTKLQSDTLKTEEAFRELEQNHLPRLRAFEKDLASLPAYTDQRKNAVVELRSAVRAWIESLEFRGQAISTLDPAYNDRAKQSEDIGYANLTKATRSFKSWKMKSQNEIQESPERMPSQADP